MAWVRVPPEHHPIFREALPTDRRIEIAPMFGGLAARVNGHIFAGLFGRSAMIWLPEAERAEALALEGAARFDPMGDGRKSDKVMLPEAFMEETEELARWLARAFAAASKLPPKAAKAAKSGSTKRSATAPKKAAAKTRAAPKAATRAKAKR